MNSKLWVSLTLFLIAGIICGTVLLIAKTRDRPQEITINPPQLQPYQGQIHLDGAVSSPGYYTWKEKGTLHDLLEEAGLSSEADLNRLRLYVSKTGEGYPPQKVNLNRAPLWLLEALPGIGPAKAQDIIDYRTQNGPFSRPEDILKIKNISHGIYDKIKDFITVED